MLSHPLKAACQENNIPPSSYKRIFCQVFSYYIHRFLLIQLAFPIRVRSTVVRTAHPYGLFTFNNLWLNVSWRLIQEAPENHLFLTVLIQDQFAGFSAPVIQELTIRADYQKKVAGQKGSQSRLGLWTSDIQGATLCPIYLWTEHQLLFKRCTVFENYVSSHRQFMGNDAQGYQFFGPGSSSGKMALPKFSNPGVVSDRKCCSLAKRPFQVGISLLRASTSFTDPTGLSDTGNHSSIWAKVLCTLETLDVTRLIQNR